jgi:hypothetical protein
VTFDAAVGHPHLVTVCLRQTLIDARADPLRGLHSTPVEQGMLPLPPSPQTWMVPGLEPERLWFAEDPFRDPLEPQVASWAGTETHPVRQQDLMLLENDLEHEIPYKIAELFSKARSGSRMTYIPLLHLTNQAISRYCWSAHVGTDKLSFNKDTLMFKTVALQLNEDGKDAMPVEEWMQAWRRLLQLYSQYLPEECHFWKGHVVLIHNTEGTYGKNWPLWRAYNIATRKRAITSSFDPSKLQPVIYNWVEREHIKNLAIQQVAAAVTVRFPGQVTPAAASAVAVPAKSGVKAAGTGPTATAALSTKPARPFCFVCGGRNHYNNACTASTQADGGPLLLVG